jgi:hypothetical protein
MANNNALYIGLCVWFDLERHKACLVGQNSREELSAQMEVHHFQLWMQLTKVFEVAFNTRGALNPLPSASHRR